MASSHAARQHQLRGARPHLDVVVRPARQVLRDGRPAVAQLQVRPDDGGLRVGGGWGGQEFAPRRTA